MNNEYNQNYKRLGGLGPNIGSPEWFEKKEKKEKMKTYVNTLKSKSDSPTNE